MAAGRSIPAQARCGRPGQTLRRAMQSHSHPSAESSAVAAGFTPAWPGEQRGREPMSIIRNVTHHVIYKHPTHCVNQTVIKRLQNGELMAVFNEERYPYHHDSGQTLLIRSRDGGRTWDEKTLKV